MYAFACCRDSVAVGLAWAPIIILNAITGSQMAALSGHRCLMRSLAFSANGILLASGGDDTTVKLWDVQTGGVVRAFNGHTGDVVSISISVDCTTIASGSWDLTLRLWDIQTGECYQVIEWGRTGSLCFSPLVPQYLISASGGKVQQWDIRDHQIAPTFDLPFNGSHSGFSSDGSQFFVCNGEVVEVRSSDSGEVVAQLHMADIRGQSCCFSPDGKLIAVAAGCTACVWDISGSDPQLIETFTDHFHTIASLAFASSTSLISASNTRLFKFWQIGSLSKTPVVIDPEATSLTSAPIKSITLQAREGITISSHSDGMVKIWDIMTGICKASFQIPSKNFHWLDTQLIDGRLISVWCTDEKITIWDTENSEPLRMVDAPEHKVVDLRISGDGSMVICLDTESIQGWSLWTGEVVGKTDHCLFLSNDSFLIVDGLRVWTPFNNTGAKAQGWDFGTSDLSTMELSNVPPNWPHLNFIGIVRGGRQTLPGIEDTATGKVVFQPPGRLARPLDAQWDGQYLVAGYDSGEVLILEYTNVFY